MADLKLKRLDNVPAYLSHRAIVAVGSADDYLLYIGNNSNQPVPFNSPVPEVVETLPEPDAEKAGQPFILNGTEWVYNYELNGVKRFEGLDVGVPWPVKGYKEYVGGITQTGTNAPVLLTPTINELSNTLSTTRSVAGNYTISNIDSGKILVQFANGWFEEESQRSDFYTYAFGSSVFITTLNPSNVPADGLLSSFVTFDIQIKVYPPND